MILVMSLWNWICRMTTDTGTGKLDLSFLSTDVRNQIAHSKDLLEQIKVLRSTVEEIKEPEAKAKLHETIKRLLKLLDAMTSNVVTTTANSTTTITTSGVGYLFPAPKPK